MSKQSDLAEASSAQSDNARLRSETDLDRCAAARTKRLTGVLAKS
jgi:hypothetical protein